MRLAHTNRLTWLLSMLAMVAALIGGTALTIAKTNGAVSITVTNSSQRAIMHLYLAPPGDPNNWGPDQLNGSTIPTGGSHVLNDACGAGGVRVIAEDQNGCFVYYNASCDANQTWEVTDNVAPDCGG